MTGGLELRRRPAKSLSEQFFGTMSTAMDDIVDLGKVPPPALTVPRPIAIRSGKPSSSSAQFIFGDLQKGNRRDSACRLLEMKIDSGLQRSKNQFVAAQRTK